MNGYDHNYELPTVGSLEKAARLHHAASGRTIAIYTTEPAIQLFTGNTLHESIIGNGGIAMPIHAGVALETQQFPDAPNNSNFPSAIIRPGAAYVSRTEYRFAVDG